MFNYIGGTFFSYVDHFVNQVSTQLSIYVAVIALSALTLYYLFVGFSVMRDEVREPISNIAWRSAKMAMILFIAFSAGFYQAEIIGTVKTVSANLMSSVAVSTTGSGACPVAGVKMRQIALIGMVENFGSIY